MTEKELSKLTVADLREKAKSLGLKKINGLKKQELIDAIISKEQADSRKYSKLKDPISNSFTGEGVVEVLPEGFGFIKPEGAKSLEENIYVAASQIQRFKIKSGDVLSGKVRPPKDGEKYYAMLFLEVVNGRKTSDLL